MELSRKSIALYLILITLASLGLKLYTIDFSIPFSSDNLGYTLRAISHNNGDFSQMPDKGLGWSILISPFFHLIDSNSLIDYSNVVRVLSICIASASIFVVYRIGRKYFDQKYSLVVASLFAFEPHLNYNAGFGLTEPIYHLVILGAFYFTLSNKTKYIIPSLALAGVLWWIRINGLSIFIVISIIYFITQRKNPNLFRNYGLGIAVFLLIVSPMLMQRYDQFGDPFYFWYNERIFAGDYEVLVSSNSDTNQSAIDYVEKNGILSFIHTFVLTGIYNIFGVLSKISLPYLFILLPFGIIFSFRAFDQNTQYIKANWIFILASLGLMVVTFSIVPERRYLFFLFPFLIIFATIPIQRVVEYGLSTFSFSDNQKNRFLIMVISLVFVLSLLFVIYQYGKPDLVFENEKIEFAKFIVSNLNGKILDDSGPALEYTSYVVVNDPPGDFKHYKISKNELQEFDKNRLDRIYIYAESIEDLLPKGKSYGLKYIISNEKKGYFHQYVDDLYYKEEQYSYLKKVFDSNENGFTKLKIKVFEIDYDKFASN